MGYFFGDNLGSLPPLLLLALSPFFTQQPNFFVLNRNWSSHCPTHILHWLSMPTEYNLNSSLHTEHCMWSGLCLASQLYSPNYTNLQSPNTPCLFFSTFKKGASSWGFLREKKGRNFHFHSEWRDRWDQSTSSPLSAPTLCPLSKRFSGFAHRAAGWADVPILLQIKQLKTAKDISPSEAEEQYNIWELLNIILGRKKTL